MARAAEAICDRTNSRIPPEAAVAGSLAPNRRTRSFSDIQAGDRMAGAGRKRTVRSPVKIARNGHSLEPLPPDDNSSADWSSV